MATSLEQEKDDEANAERMAIVLIDAFPFGLDFGRKRPQLVHALYRFLQENTNDEN